MANNDWSDFMSSRMVRIACDAIVIAACARYAGEAGRALISPDTAGVLYESLGKIGFYALYGAQALICAFVIIQFARRLVKDIADKPDKGQ